MRPAGAPRILFLDPDHVLQIFYQVLTNQEDSPGFRAWFAPEPVDPSPLVAAVQGLRPSEGAVVGQGWSGGPDTQDADILIFRRGEVTAGMMDRHPRLRLVQRLGERSDGIDLAHARQRGIQVSCLPRPTLAYTAEHVLLLALALGKQLLLADRAVREGTAAVGGAPGQSAYNWAGVPGAKGLQGATLGIVGLGEVGSLVARRAKAFGMQVLYYKPTRADAAVEEALGVRYCGLHELLGQADYVSLNIADRPETRGFADASFFAAMKPGACFINTSRGHLVDEDALYQALVDKRIAGAGLDVHAQEPRPGSDRFCALPQVILTPHLGGGARSGVLQEFAVMAASAMAALRGEPVRYAVD